MTDQRGSPQTLVCTKTQTSYERRLHQYEEDQRVLRELESLVSGPASEHVATVKPRGKKPRTR